MTDIVVPPEKKDMVKAAEKKVEEITRMFHRGMLTEEERYKSVLSIWDETTKRRHYRAAAESRKVQSNQDDVIRELEAA